MDNSVQYRGGVGKQVYRYRVVAGNGIACLGLIVAVFDPDAHITLPHLIVGTLVGLAGFAARIWAAAYQWPNLARDSLEARTGLITAGPYAYVRHPIYLGMLLLTSGMFIGLGSWRAAAATLIPTLILNVWQARFEERFLVESYGKQASDYRNRLPLLLPKVWDPYPTRNGAFSFAHGIKHDVGPLSAFVCFVVIMAVVVANHIPTTPVAVSSILATSVLVSFAITGALRRIFKHEFDG